MKTPVLFALALAAAAPLATVAHADQPTAVGVRFNDLNLSKPTDAAVMLGRLDHAAMQACGAAPFESLREYQSAIRHSRCYVRGVGRAIATLDAPAVTAIFDRQYGRSE
jgi:UrcA family protein